METLRKILEFDLMDIGTYHITVSSIVVSIAILVITWLLIWLVRKLFQTLAKKRGIEEGRWYAFYQIIKYFAWAIAVSLALETIGIKITILIASSAALFVGIGLGMQSIFKDIFSGLVLLFEGTVRIDDVLDIDGEVIKVIKIGIRTSEVLDRDDVNMIIPNSFLVSNKVVNWSHNARYCRFVINVGVSYGSDVDKVIELLTEAAAEHPSIYKPKKPFARLVDFGNSSLDFELLFWSSNMFRIRNVKSDIRRSIIKKFEEHHITIPFPQRDVHIRQT